MLRASWDRSKEPPWPPVGTRALPAEPFQGLRRPHRRPYPGPRWAMVGSGGERPLGRPVRSRRPGATSAPAPDATGLPGGEGDRDATLRYGMDVRGFCTQSRVLIVAGKGGVGKTTMVAALARVAADAGLSVLVVELEGRTGVTAAFGQAQALGYDEVVLDAAADGDPVEQGTVRARMVTPDDALVEYLVDHGFRRISKRLVASGIVDVVSSAIPGIRDVLVLGKVKQLERAGVADLVLVDAPATGHALTFLSSAGGLLDAARSGPVRTQAADVAELLADPARCQVVLVTLPEEMPVNEVVDAAYQLEDRVGVALGPVVVNGCLAEDPGLDVPAAEAVEQAGQVLAGRLVEGLERARWFHLRRVALQHEQLDRLARDLPLPQLRVPYVFTDRIGPTELAVLASALAGGIAGLPDPASVAP